MRALFINLAADAARRDFQEAQLARLGLVAERVPAVDGSTLTPPPDDPYWLRWERPLRLGEKAILASHRDVWRRIAAGDGPALVLEDDAVLVPAAVPFLAALHGAEGIDHVTLEVRGRRKLVARTAHPALPMRRLWQDYTGAAAYVLWPSGARKLLARVARRPGLADAVLCAARDLVSFQADPGLATQLDQIAGLGLTPPLVTQSGVLSEAKPSRRDAPPAERRAYAARRLATALDQGLVRLRHAGAATRRDIAMDMAGLAAACRPAAPMDAPPRTA